MNPGEERRRWRDRSGFIWKTAILLLLLWTVSHGTIYTEYGYFCEVTGSRKGHSKWAFGAEFNRWYHKSELEAFLEGSGGKGIEHRWTSYKGTGRDIFRRATYRGHGSPGPFFSVRKEFFDNYVQSLDDAGRRELHSLMVRGDEERMEERLQEIWSSSWK